MIQVLFFLRFKTQLRRTRPELTFQLEKAISTAFEVSGGKVEQNYRIIVGYFDEHALGIWLNIITLLEGIIALLDSVAAELYGYSLIISENLEDYEQGRIGSSLAAKPGNTRIWCSTPVKPLLSPYAEFEANLLKVPEFTRFTSDEDAGYVQVKRLASSRKSDPVSIDSPHIQERFSLRDKILHIIKYGAARNVILVGPTFMGKREGLYRFCAETLGDIPPLILRFGSRKNLGYLGDMFSPHIRRLMEGHLKAEQLEELDGLQAVLFRERLMDEYSSYLIQKSKLFFTNLIWAYSATMQYWKLPPMLILEDINNADDTMTQLVLDVCKAMEDKTALHIYGTYSYETTAKDSDRRLQCWEGIFPKTLRFPPEYYPTPKMPDLSLDLWEVAYTASLLKPYFPGFLFPQLFEEEESTAAMALRAFTMLSQRGIIDRIDDPIPRIPHFTYLAEARLGERKAYIRHFVRNRILAWVRQGKLRSCFGMLEILAALGGRGDDGLVLNAIYGDVISGTYQGIEQAIKEDRFGVLVGTDKRPTLLYIFTTLKALIHGNEGEIREAFTRPAPQGITFSGHRIHILVNLTCYYLGIKDLDTALETVKEAMLIGQRQKQGVTRVYRLFALVNLVRHQIRDAMDYISFAVENAEWLRQFDILTVSAYYAASIQFLFGNLSWAEQLALKAEQAALSSGQSDWRDRIRFFRGKLRFEIGSYQDALDIFKALQENPAGSVSPEQEQLLAAWIYRTMVYLGRRILKPVSMIVDSVSGLDHGLDLPSVAADAFLFEVEASYITGDYQRTISLTDMIQINGSNPVFLYTERPDWRSGFAQCELLQVDPQAFWERMLLTYRGLALCRLPSPRANQEKDIQRIQQFIRNDLLPDQDAHDIFYFYAYYRILQESNASDIDLNTAVSIAFKRLQHRANRIEDIETRGVFLHFHYWNNALSIAARDHKLI
jgi:tetratricopeptide (TPR) repeat protein